MPNEEKPRGAVADRDGSRDSAVAALPQLDIIADAVRDVLCVADTQGRLIWWNRRLEAATGLRAAKLRNRPILGLFDEQQRGAVEEVMQRAIGGCEGEGEWDLLTASGAVPHHFKSVVVKDGNGKVAGVACIGRDISETRRTQEAGRQWTELTQGFLSAMSDLGQGVALVAAERLVYANDALSDITGYSREELLAMPSLIAVISPEDRPRVAERMRKRRNDEAVLDHAEVTGIHKDGHRFHVEFSVKAIAIGGKDQYFTIIRDITAVRNAEEAARREAAYVRLLQSIAVVANGAESADEALQFAVDRICYHAGWPVGHVYLRDRASGDFISSGIWFGETADTFRALREATDVTSFVRGIGLPGWVAVTGKPAWSTDLARQQGFARYRAAKRTGIRAGFAFPVMVGAEVAAVLEFFSQEADEPDEQWLEVMAHVGTQLGRVIERKRAQEELQRSEDRYRNLLDSSPEAIAVYAGKGQIVLANAAAAQLVGAEGPEALVGKTVWDFIHPEDSALIRKRGRRLAKGDQTLPPAELRFRRLDGSEVVVESIARSVTFEGSPAVQVSARDITAREVESEKILARQLRDLERIQADLEQFAYAASHDLQEPLRMVSSYLQLLKRRYMGRLDGDADDFIHFAVDGAQRMQRLISDLLAYSRVGTRGQPFRPTDFNQALDNALDGMKESFEKARAILTREPLPKLVADGSQVEQLFQNLLGNAVKFSNGRRPRIHVGARETKGEWVFSVRDNGIGVNPEDADRIFGIFQRLHARDEYPGTGVGLAVCKRIVERRGGRIWVDSKPGKGATFYFTMPQRGEARVDRRR